jgi:molybdate transport system substrate-binding protein
MWREAKLRPALSIQTDAKIEAQVDVVLEIPAEAHKPIIYPATYIKSSQQAELSKALPFIPQSQESQTVFKENGFFEASKK